MSSALIPMISPAFAVGDVAPDGVKEKRVAAMSEASPVAGWAVIEFPSCVMVHVPWVVAYWQGPPQAGTSGSQTERAIRGRNGLARVGREVGLHDLPAERDLTTTH
jgi:hypothetical protein